MVIEAAGEAPIVLDMGTGIRNYGLGWDNETPFEGSILLTHLHWDHVQGLPFFKPLHQDGAKISIYGPPEDGQQLGQLFDGLMRQPYFPICCDDLIGDVRFHDVETNDFTIGGAAIKARPVPHTGATNGYRIEVGGIKIAYISDHQQPIDNPTHVADEVLELAEGVDLLIHDAQYSPKQFAERALWGHSTMEYACEVARQAEATGLVLFHHDPDNTDVVLSALVDDARRVGARMGLGEVIAAREGESIKFD